MGQNLYRIYADFENSLNLVKLDNEMYLYIYIIFPIDQVPYNLDLN